MAALIVFISHSANEALLPSFLGQGFGKVGVMLFFILSGFLMAHLYLREEFTLSNVVKYAAARIGRVVPLYYALIGVSVVICNYIYADFCFPFNDAGVVFQSVFFIHAPSLFWTIPAEVQFYVVFIILWALFSRYSSKILLGVFVLSASFQIAKQFIDIQGVPEFLGRYSFAFLLGVITSLYYRHIRDNVLLRRVASVLSIPLLILLFINLPVLREMSGLIFGGGDHLIVWEDPVSWGIVYLLFVCVLLNSKGLMFLSSRPLVFMGDISYGFYLIHFPILLFFCSLALPSIVKLVLAFVATC
ncbi:MAG: acyltransferase, partial [Pontiellaceae bacterium]|nr:acyltransferase [Pontiellaceae bacterium]